MTEAAIYKILRAEEFSEANRLHQYRGSEDDRRDGFIHFSTAAQLEGTLDKYFRGMAVHILSFNPEKLGEKALRWEPSRRGMLFPHLYDTLDITLAEGHWRIEVPSRGCCDLPTIENILT